MKAFPGGNKMSEPLYLSAAAAAKVLELMCEEDNFALKLRVYVTGGGCSGFQYGFAFEEGEKEGDTCVMRKAQLAVAPGSDGQEREDGKDGKDEEESGGHMVTLLVDPISLQYLSGAEIDYREDIEGAQFIIRNPNAKTTCGCGASFSA